MSQISAAAVKALRDRTDMPMMKCKAALEKAGGDMDKAILILREEGGKFLASDKGARETAEGRIGAFSDHKTAGALVELRCESPSVVKNDKFVDLHEDRPFKEKINVRLKERNGARGGNNDKDLGLKTFHKDELSDGNNTEFGTEDGGVSYTLDYRITA